MKTPTTGLSRHTDDAIYYRDQDLVAQVLGQASFIEVFARQLTGRVPTPEQTQMFDAVLIAIMEHGLTPSAIAARLVYGSSPENLQAGVAAGLLAVASRFVGTMEDSALIVREIVEAGDDGQNKAREIASHYRREKKNLPGFGHHLHKPDDPRALKLLEMARERGIQGDYCRGLELLGKAVDEAWGRHITINATGAVGAILGDLGIPIRLMRGFAVLSRAAGLVTHISEEQADPTMRFVWDLVDRSVPFDADKAEGGSD